MIGLPQASPSSPADRVEDTDTTCFAIQAAADPGVIPRVVALFAKRGLTPKKVVSLLTEAGTLEIDVQVAGLPAEDGGYLAECLRQLVPVRSVLVAMRRPG